MSLADELAGDQDPRTGSCKMCVWLRGLSQKERAEWAEAMDNRAWTTASLIRAAQRREPNLGKTVIESHRRKQHKP